MRKKTSLIIAIFLSCFCVNTFSQEKTTSIFAPISCSTWLTDRADRSTVSIVNHRWGTLFNETWLLGLVSGLNANDPSPKDLLSSVNSDLIFDWMDNYCKVNPKESVFDGAVLLLEEISKFK